MPGDHPQRHEGCRPSPSTPQNRAGPYPCCHPPPPPPHSALEPTVPRLPSPSCPPCQDVQDSANPPTLWERFSPAPSHREFVEVKPNKATI